MADGEETTRLDPERSRYLIEVGGEPAGVAQFVEHGEQRVFTHTIVEERFEGRGLGGRLVRFALDDTRSAGKRIVPICSFVARYVSSHDDWADLIDEPTDELRESLAD